MGSDGMDPAAFSLDVVPADDGPTSVRVAGELDLVTAGQLQDAISDALEAAGVVLDLGEVTFMDSSGVRALNTAMSEAADRGRDLRIRSEMHPNVVQVLRITGMLELLPVEGAP